MKMIKIKISLVNIFANSKLETPFNCITVISFDVYSLLREIMIPKKRPRDINNGEYWTIFKANNLIKKTDAMSPSLTSSTNLRPVLARSIRNKIKNTARDVLAQFLYKY
tara:strand:+ start:620 stop:946 length:327 start_codon:yes stop_codon:yes gene_type:complete